MQIIKIYTLLKPNIREKFSVFLFIDIERILLVQIYANLVVLTSINKERRMLQQCNL
jgi:hypothetical protein